MQVEALRNKHVDKDGLDTSRHLANGLEALLNSLGLSTPTVGFVIENKAAWRAQRGKSRSKLSQTPPWPVTDYNR